VAEVLPQARAVVHDKFHVSASLMGEAVDQVRRGEHQRLLGQGDERLRARATCGFTIPTNSWRALGG